MFIISWHLGYAISRQSYLVEVSANGPQRNAQWPQGGRGPRLRNHALKNVPQGRHCILSRDVSLLELVLKHFQKTRRFRVIFELKSTRSEESWRGRDPWILALVSEGMHGSSFNVSSVLRNPLSFLKMTLTAFTRVVYLVSDRFWKWSIFFHQHLSHSSPPSDFLQISDYVSGKHQWLHTKLGKGPARLKIRILPDFIFDISSLQWEKQIMYEAYIWKRRHQIFFLNTSPLRSDQTPLQPFTYHLNSIWAVYLFLF